MIDYSLILTKNYNGKQWVLRGESYDGLEWLDESTKPTQAELDALWESTQAQVAAAAQAEEAHRQSAIAKLTAIGLTADEIAALGVK
jgi:hypothetical protein